MSSPDKTPHGEKEKHPQKAAPSGGKKPSTKERKDAQKQADAEMELLLEEAGFPVRRVFDQMSETHRKVHDAIDRDTRGGMPVVEAVLGNVDERKLSDIITDHPLLIRLVDRPGRSMRKRKGPNARKECMFTIDLPPGGGGKPTNVTIDLQHRLWRSGGADDIEKALLGKELGPQSGVTIDGLTGKLDAAHISLILAETIMVVDFAGARRLKMRDVPETGAKTVIDMKKIAAVSPEVAEMNRDEFAEYLENHWTELSDAGYVSCEKGKEKFTASFHFDSSAFTKIANQVFDDLSCPYTSPIFSIVKQLSAALDERKVPQMLVDTATDQQLLVQALAMLNRYPDLAVAVEGKKDAAAIKKKETEIKHAKALKTAAHTVHELESFEKPKMSAAKAGVQVSALKKFLDLHDQCLMLGANCTLDFDTLSIVDESGAKIGTVNSKLQLDTEEKNELRALGFDLAFKRTVIRNPTNGAVETDAEKLLPSIKEKARPFLTEAKTASDTWNNLFKMVKHMIDVLGPGGCDIKPDSHVMGKLSTLLLNGSAYRDKKTFEEPKDRTTADYAEWKTLTDALQSKDVHELAEEFAHVLDHDGQSGFKAVGHLEDEDHYKNALHALEAQKKSLEKTGHASLKGNDACLAIVQAGLLVPEKPGDAPRTTPEKARRTAEAMRDKSQVTKEVKDIIRDRIHERRASIVTNGVARSQWNTPERSYPTPLGYVLDPLSNTSASLGTVGAVTGVPAVLWGSWWSSISMITGSGFGMAVSYLINGYRTGKWDLADPDTRAAILQGLKYGAGVGALASMSWWLSGLVFAISSTWSAIARRSSPLSSPTMFDTLGAYEKKLQLSLGFSFNDSEAKLAGKSLKKLQYLYYFLQWGQDEHNLTRTLKIKGMPPLQNTKYMHDFSNRLLTVIAEKALREGKHGLEELGFEDEDVEGLMAMRADERAETVMDWLLSEEKFTAMAEAHKGEFEDDAYTSYIEVWNENDLATKVEAAAAADKERASTGQTVAAAGGHLYAAGAWLVGAGRGIWNWLTEPLDGPKHK